MSAGGRFNLADARYRGVRGCSGIGSLDAVRGPVREFRNLFGKYAHIPRQVPPRFRPNLAFSKFINCHN
jgi:hypothetical protein